MLFYDIVPQIRPVVAGVSVSRGDINIRETTAPGIVGAGVGFVLNEAVLGFEWERVGPIPFAILAVVALSEVSSAWIRGRRG